MAIQFNFEKAALNALYQRRQEEQRRKYMADAEGHRNKVFDYNVERHEADSKEKKAFNEAQMLLFKKFLGVEPAQEPAPVVAENTDLTMLLGNNPGGYTGNWGDRPLQGTPPDKVSNVEIAQKILTDMSKKKKDSNKKLNPFVGAATGVTGGVSTPSVEVVNTPSVNPYLKYRDVSIYNRDSKDPLLTDADLQPVMTSEAKKLKYDEKGNILKSNAKKIHHEEAKEEYLNQQINEMEINNDVPLEKLEFPDKKEFNNLDVNPYKRKTAYGFAEAFGKKIGSALGNKPILKQAMENGAAEKAPVVEKAPVIEDAKKYTITKDTSLEDLLKWQKGGHKDYDDLIKKVYDGAAKINVAVGDITVERLDRWDSIRDEYLTAGKAKADARDALTARAEKALLKNPKTATEEEIIEAEKQMAVVDNMRGLGW